MDCIRLRLARGVNDPLGVEITVLRPRPADEDHLTGFAGVTGAGIGFRINGDGLQSQPFTTLDDPASNLAAIGDQYFTH